MKRIHIVCASPRTGSTLMAEAMRTCFGIDVGAAHEERIYAAPPGQGDVFLSKHPRDVLVIGPLLAVLPELYVIYMLRDPRDIVTSKHGEAPDRYWTGLNYWKTYSHYGDKLRRHPRVVTVRYEDFVTAPDRTQELLEQRFPFLNRRARFSEYHQSSEPCGDSLLALGGVRPIRPEGIGNWQRHLPRIAGQLAQHGSISQDLIFHGYETDESWLDLLAGVKPDLQPSRLPEAFPPGRIRRERVGAYRYAARVLKRRLLGQEMPYATRRA
jgi:hypothetical protein